MARTILPIAGFIIGNIIAPGIGGRIGWLIGAAIGGAVDPQHIKGPSLGDLPVQTSRLGGPRPLVFGKVALFGNIMDRGDPVIKVKHKRQGKGGPVVDEEHVYMTYAIRIAEGPVRKIWRIWEDEKLVYDVTAGSTLVKESTKYATKMKIYLGDTTQLPDPDLEIVHGVGNVPAHRGTAYIVYPRRDLNDFGGRVPQTRFEVEGTLGESASATDWDEDGFYQHWTLGSGRSAVTTSSVNYGEGLAATTGHDASGSHYFEVEIVAGGIGTVVGICNGTYRSTWPGSNAGPLGAAGTFAYFWDGYIQYNGASPTTYAAAYTTGDVIGILLKNGKLYLRKNGAWQGGANPVAETGYAASGLTGTYYPCIDASTYVRSFIGNFEESDLSGSLITGASAWGVPATVTLGAILAHLADRVDVDNTEIDVSAQTQPVRGFLVAGDYTAGEAIRSLQPIFAFDPVDYDGVLHFVQRGGATVLDLDEAEMVDVEDESTREQEIEYPKYLFFKYRNPNLSYAETTLPSERTSPDIRVKGEITFTSPVVMLPDEAAQVADILHKVAWADADGEVKAQLPDNYSRLVATDCWNGTWRGRTRRLRIEKREQLDGVLSLTCRYDRQNSYVSTATGNPPRDPLPPPNSYPGDTIFRWLNIPGLLDSDDDLGYRVIGVGTEPGWPGARLQRSLDGGANFEDVADFGHGAVLGELVDPLPAASEFVLDVANTLRVQIYGPPAELESCSYEQLLGSANACAVRQGDEWELVQFQTAVQESTDTWALTTLLRGRRATVPVLHDAGEAFVLLDYSQFVKLGGTYIGRDLVHRAPSYGNPADDADEETNTWSPARSQTEFAPLFLTLARDGSDIITGSWIGRCRFGSSVNPIHSVNFQGYRITLDDGVLPAVTLPDQLTTSFTYDASALGSPLTVSVAGLNRYTGAGPTVSESI